MGDSDIFMTKYNTQTQSWSIPKNLGFPINTEKSEGALSISLDGKTAYFASDQLNKDNARNLDVLYFELPEELKPEPLTFVKIHTISSQGINLSNVKFSLKDNNSGKEILSSFTDESANAIFSISPGLNYNLTFEKDGYAFTSKNIRLDSINQAISPYIMQVKLHKLEVEKTTETESIILNNLFFKTASAEISSESTIEIENLYQLLYDNTAISIKIIGHTDNVGNPDQNKILSEERAKSVKSALVQKGINTNRIFIEGKGEENPIADNETIEGREINRRTEFVILSN
jgi:outer membrane protein OmpA-like peptidoglycan-associated protein